MRPAVLTRGRDLGGTSAVHDERAPLLFGHAAHRTRAYSARSTCSASRSARRLSPGDASNDLGELPQS
jgi:hypothetical protein